MKALVLLTVAAIASTAAAEPRPTLEVVQTFDGIDLVHTINQVSHIHGGAAATIASASLNFQPRDGKPHIVIARRLELLHASCNDEQRWADRTRLAVTGYKVYSWDDATPIAEATDRARLPATRDLLQVALAFAGRSAYQACDRFAFAVTLDVDGKAATVELPLDVIRKQPLRRPDAAQP